MFYQGIISVAFQGESTGGFLKFETMRARLLC